jgi:dienelactone hydrolase
MRLFSGLILMGIIFVSSSSNAAVVTKEVDYKHGKIELRGTLAYDDSVTSLRPGVLLLPEWWGHNDYIKQRAHELAENGYIVFAADMYGTDQVTGDPQVATAWSKPFYENRDLMRRRARAALAVLLKQKNIDRHKVAAVGFCMGGTVALELARSGDDLRGVAAFHAGLEFPNKLRRGAVRAKVLVLNGGADPMVPPAQREDFIEEMQASGADLQFILYGGAMHAFTNPNADKFKIKGVSYNEKAEKRSFQALQSFFEEVFARRS